MHRSYCSFYNFAVVQKNACQNRSFWVRGPVIQANGRLIFEDDLRSGGLLCFNSMNASVRTELADSMVTPGGPGGD